jgi:hypothetical protein
MTDCKTFYSLVVSVILTSFLEASLAKAEMPISENSASHQGCEEIRHLYLDSLDNMMSRLGNNLDHISEADDLVKAINIFVDSLVDFRSKEESIKVKYPELFIKKEVANWKICNLEQVVEQKNNNEWKPTKEALNNAIEHYKTNASVLKARQRLHMIK